VAAPALATTIKVKNHHDSGPGSLRHAIATADPADEVVVPADTYQLTSGELLVNEALTIKGAGAKKTIITAGGKSRVLEVGSSVGPVAISGATITGGKADAGGGILNGGTLTLKRDVIRDNLASGASGNYGGGINNTGTLTLVRSKVSSNETGKRKPSLGGGIAVGSSTGPVTIMRSSLTGNAARGRGFGGAIAFQPTTFTQSAGLTITKSTIAHNTAAGGPAGSDAFGGAIYFEPVLDSSFASPLTLTADTFAHNRALPIGSANAYGGAILFEPIANVSGASAPLTLVNDTIAANAAGVPGAGSFGGGLYVEPITNSGSTAPQSFTNVTISANVAAGSGSGGGLHISELGSSPPGPPSLWNTIVAKNKATTGPDCDGTVTSLGHNLERHTSCGLTAAGAPERQRRGDPDRSPPSWQPGDQCWRRRGLPADRPARDPQAPRIPLRHRRLRAQAAPHLTQARLAKPSSAFGGFESRPAVSIAGCWLAAANAAGLRRRAACPC